MIHKNVKFIGYGAFASCPKLESVYYFGINAPTYNTTKMAVFADILVTSVFVTNDYFEDDFSGNNVTVAPITFTVIPTDEPTAKPTMKPEKKFIIYALIGFVVGAVVTVLIGTLVYCIIRKKKENKLGESIPFMSEENVDQLNQPLINK